MIHQLFLESRDLLYFRDGRSVNDGCGASWPNPSTAYSALLSAFHKAWPIPQKWETIPAWSANSKGENGRFGGLKTFGPLPCRDGKIYLPTPADLKLHSIAAPIRNLPGKSNLPKNIRYPVGSAEGASKESPGKWISMDDFERYRNGDFQVETFSDNDFFESENRTGLALDANRIAQKGRLYFTSYLRLLEGVRMCLFAECGAICGEKKIDVVEQFFHGTAPKEILLGGQRGIAFARRETFDSSRKRNFLPERKEKGTCVKWILLSPAMYQSGWLPGFIEPRTGKVLLRTYTNLPREKYPSRDAWRRACRGERREIHATLTAAVIPKTLCYSGWNVQKNCPEPTKLLVPPGSVYYFEAESESDAEELALLLSGSRYSDCLGAHGFGVGVCAPFDYLDFNTMI